MRILTTVITAILLHFFLFSAPCTADIISLKLRSSRRHMILFRRFEFSPGGYVSFLIPSVTATSISSPPDRSRIGFILQNRDIRNQHRFEFQQKTKCPLDFKLNTVLFTFQDLPHDLDQSSFNKSYHVTNPGMYSLFFVNCNENSFVSMDGHAELYSTINNKTKNYLSADLTHLPCIYFVSSFVYLGFLGLWILVCLKNRQSYNTVHLMMAGLLVMNFVQLICAGVDLYYVKGTGSSHGLVDWFCSFRLIRNVLLFMVILFIITGWGIWKPNLDSSDQFYFVIVMVLQVWGNVCSLIAWKGGHWSSTSRVIDILCYIVLFVPMAVSISSLKDRRSNPTAARNLVKLRIFGVVVFVYVVLMTVLKFKLFIRWVTYGVEEIILLVFCMAMFYIYKPLDEDTDEKTVDMTWNSSIIY